MKLLKKIDELVLEQASSDFWYDLFDGGYIIPKNYLVEADAKKVCEAAAILIEFRSILEDNELIGEM